MVLKAGDIGLAPQLKNDSVTESLLWASGSRPVGWNEKAAVREYLSRCVVENETTGLQDDDVVRVAASVD
jgi:hypothetical protein